MITRHTLPWCSRRTVTTGENGLKGWGVNLGARPVNRERRADALSYKSAGAGLGGRAGAHKPTLEFFARGIKFRGVDIRRISFQIQFQFTITRRYIPFFDGILEWLI